MTVARGGCQLVNDSLNRALQGEIMIGFLKRWLVAISVVSISVAASATPIEPAQPGAWLVFLCRASDAAGEPQPPAYYQELFDPAQPDLVQAYLRAVSFGKVDVSKTLVLGWFRMAVSTADLSPAVRNVNTNPGRGQTPEDCKSAGIASLSAAGQSIDPSHWAGFIAVINVNADAGTVGRNVVANALEPASFYEHEMLHTMGVVHTFNLPNNVVSDHVWGSPTVFAYDDPWDVMSFNVGIFSYDSAKHGQTGPELNMAYRSRLGWLPANRITTQSIVRATDRTVKTLQLAPVSEPQQAGLLMVVVSLPGGIRYAIEYRKQSGFDRGVKRGEVVIREWRADQVTYLVRQKNGHVGYFPGEPAFTDSRNNLKITVGSINPASATITIDTRLSTHDQCAKACTAERNLCISQVPQPGNPSAQECVRQYGDCVAGCPR